MERLHHLSLGMAMGMTLCSCTMDKSKMGLFDFAAKYGQTITVPSSNYIAEITVQLDRPNNASPYTSGLIEYTVEDSHITSLSFNEGGDFRALVQSDTGEDFVSLGDDGDCKATSKKQTYSKVILEPLVYAEDCGYVVAGEIGFFSCEDDTWAASLDYGDGTCDDLITKKFPDEKDYVFSMDDYPELNL